MLIVFGGLPGVGKTSLSRKLAAELKAVYLRIDTVEQVLKREASLNGREGYEVCFALAEENLKCGMIVVVDAVNPINIARDSWKLAAERASACTVEIEIVCSDTIKHQQRIESRRPDISGLQLPTWQDVQSREYEPWNSKDLRIDTSKKSVNDSLGVILRYIARTAIDETNSCVSRITH